MKEIEHCLMRSPTRSGQETELESLISSAERTRIFENILLIDNWALCHTFNAMTIKPLLQHKVNFQRKPTK